MRILTALTILMAAPTSALARSGGHESGRVVEAIYVATEDGGAIPDGLLSRDLRAKVLGHGWPAVDWLRGADAEGQTFRFAVLNVTGASPTRPAYASVLVMRGEDRTFARRFSVVHEDGEWVVRDACLFPGRYALTELIESGGEPPVGPSRVC